MADEKTKLSVVASEKLLKVHAAEVVRHKGPIMLPEDMGIPVAIEVLNRRARYDEEDVTMREDLPVFLWDGALALRDALEEQFGMAMQEKTWGFFGPEPPQQISVETGPGETKRVPWGAFSLPGITGKVATGVAQQEDGRLFFRIMASVKHKDEAAIHRLIARTRELARTRSIYRGKAFSMRFKDDDGDYLQMPQPKFLALTDSPVIFTRELERAIETNLLTPIRHTDAVRASGIPLKRGALLAGVYGTGKTLTANLVAREAQEHGWTFVYVSAVGELPDALRFAQMYQPAVVFAEDVDTVAGEHRTSDVNELLNTLDGVGTKSDEIMTILTSNHAENISPAMRRPGRIDLVLEVKPPDAEAAERLVAHYGKGRIEDGEDLTEVGEILAGQIPAVIREVVERSKLEAIRRTGGVNPMVLAMDLEDSARVLKAEQELFKGKRHETSRLALEAVTRVIGAEVREAVREAVGLHADGALEER